MLMWLSLGAVVIVAFLAWNLYQRFAVDRLDAFSQKRRSTSRMVSRAELVDGNRHLAVVLSLTGTTLIYENSDMQASLDLHWMREIEYDTELATGTTPPAGKVLRLRSNSQTFEFVLAEADVARWHMIMPPRRGPEISRLDVPPVTLPPQVASAG